MIWNKLYDSDMFYSPSKSISMVAQKDDLHKKFV